MSNQIKNGKRPAPTKAAVPAFVQHDEVFANVLTVPEEIKDECAKRGLELRWGDANTMIKNGNFHPAGWTIYRRERQADSDILGFKFGNDPEGIVRRGTCVLMTRPIAQGDRHRQLLSQRAARQSGKPGQEAAKVLREMASAENVKTAVDDSFDDE